MTTKPTKKARPVATPKAPSASVSKVDVKPSSALVADDVIEDAQTDADLNGEATTAASDSIAEAPMLAKVRSQSNSGLENQRKAAGLLVAVDQTIAERNEVPTATAYFGSLMTLLDHQQESSDEDLLAAIVYLLSIVFSHVPSSVLRIKFPAVSTILAELLEAHLANGPLVRWTMPCLSRLLTSLSPQTWLHHPTPKRLLTVLLHLTLDPRPKVRRKAVECVVEVVGTPPKPARVHPVAVGTILEWATGVLEGAPSAPNSIPKKHRKHDSDDESDSTSAHLHCLALLRSALPILLPSRSRRSVLPDDASREKLNALVRSLLSLPGRIGDQDGVVSGAVLKVLTAILCPPVAASAADESVTGPSPAEVVLLDESVRAVVEMRPKVSDSILIGQWIELVSGSVVRLAQSIVLAKKAEMEELETRKAMGIDDPESGAQDEGLRHAADRYPKVFTQALTGLLRDVMGGSETREETIAAAAAAAVDMVKGGVTQGMIDALKSGRAKALVDVGKLIEMCMGTRFRTAWGGVLMVVAAVFEQPLERALEFAVRAVGVERALALAPLNMDREDPMQPPRPYLLHTVAKSLSSCHAPSSELKDNRPVTSDFVFGPDSLAYYNREMIPLAKKLFEKSATFWQRHQDLQGDAAELVDNSDEAPRKRSGPSEGQIEAKLFETLGTQVWAILPGLTAAMPRDVAGGGFSTLAPHLGKMLQNPIGQIYPGLAAAPDLRGFICASLANIVDGNYAIVSAVNSSTLELPDEIVVSARDNLAEVRRLANRFLSTLCNNFMGSVEVAEAAVDVAGRKKGAAGASDEKAEREKRYYEKAIRSFLNIADGKDTANYFATLLKNLHDYHSKDIAASASRPSTSRAHAMMDLAEVVVNYLPEIKNHGAPALVEPGLADYFALLLRQIADPDPSLQKKSYRSLISLIELTYPKNPIASRPTASVIPDIGSFMDQLVSTEAVQVCAAAARKARLQLLALAAARLAPADSETGRAMLLRFVPMALSEAMLGTKEPSERSRHAAYDCLVEMGRKMLDGGRIAAATGAMISDGSILAKLQSRGDVDGDEMDTGAAYKGEVSISEYFVMAVAGLAGASPHMQSAAIASVARLFYEFKEDLPPALVKDLIPTILHFAASKSAEVAKGAIGFIKVVITGLPQERLEEHLEAIILSLLNHSRDRSSRLRSRSRHVLELLCRRFSFEVVEGFVPEEDKKLMQNIKKKKERTKKNRALKASGKGGFEDAMYGDDSESDGDEKYLPERFKSVSLEDKKAPGKSGIWIDEDALSDDSSDVDAPAAIDLLDPRAVSRAVTTRDPTRQGRGRVQKQANDDMDEFEVDDEGKLVIAEDIESDEENAGEGIYMEALEGEGAVKRTPGGKMKFATGRKRGRDEDEETGWDDEEADKPTNDHKDPRLGKRSKIEAPGKEYRAKRAAGDIKREGKPDPYAYIPLDPKIVGKRGKSAKSAGQFRGVIKAAHSGAKMARMRMKSVTKTRR
ncbi:hypothetical protein HDU93_005705 [Gonapodya sp. JEL0774]|nr:hypothetical protein HDU93_005705 [Gonapodya sp. JEL0774]